MHPIRPDRIEALVAKLGIARPKDLARHGVPRWRLDRLVNEGRLARVGRGLYIVAESELSEQHSTAAVARRVPRGVVCLLSALRIHGLTSQSTHEVWLAIGIHDRAPRPDYPPIRVVRMSGAALTEGIEERLFDGVTVRVFSPAKTVADCFKYRNKIGVDVALEALRDYRRRFRGKTDELLRSARICRVESVMRPYLESMS